MEILSSENWSKLFTLAEYGAWCAAYPKVMNKFNSNSNMQPIQKTIESIIDGLPQNLQGVGKMLAFPSLDHSGSDYEKTMAELFHKKVKLPA